jgi:hypothetical protein
MQYIIPTKLVGVSFKNSDGGERQELIRGLKEGDVLTIEPEPTNPYDQYSHIIKSPEGKILGHVSRSLAYELHEKVNKNNERIIGITEWKQTGGGKQTLGLNVLIRMEKRGEK